MGAVSSYMGRGMPKAQMMSWVMNALYSNFVKEEIKSFEDFHVAILEIFNSFNASLPGKHYDVPTRPEIKKCFDEWEKATNGEKKKVFMEFMTTSVTINKLDQLTLFTGLMTPPVAMAAKRAGENIPQLMLIRAVPDVVFVPSATVFALISVKVSRTMFSQKLVKPEQPTTA